MIEVNWEKISREDPKLDELIQNKITEITSFFSKAPQEGLRWKRTPWDNLREKDRFHVQGLKHEFNLIINKQSQLPKSERDAVSEFMHQVLAKYLELKGKEYGNQEESGNQSPN